MNKAELINAMSSETGLTKSAAKKLLNSFISITSNTLRDGGKVTLVGFGTFQVIDKVARRGCNPRTKALITIPAKRFAKFKVGSDLSKLVK